jgi:uncharacterized protein YybS (DUF2232 family)
MLPGREPGPDIRESAPQFWEPVWEFVVHGVVGTAIFLIVAGFAVLIDLLVRWLETRHAVSGEILQSLRWTSLAIFATDIFLIFVFLIKTAYRTARKL